jgi:hypothetical protein
MPLTRCGRRSKSARGTTFNPQENKDSAKPNNLKDQPAMVEQKHPSVCPVNPTPNEDFIATQVGQRKTKIHFSSDMDCSTVASCFSSLNSGLLQDLKEHRHIAEDTLRESFRGMMNKNTVEDATKVEAAQSTKSLTKLRPPRTTREGPPSRSSLRKTTRPRQPLHLQGKEMAARLDERSVYDKTSVESVWGFAHLNEAPNTPFEQFSQFNASHIHQSVGSDPEKGRQAVQPIEAHTNDYHGCNDSPMTEPGSFFGAYDVVDGTDLSHILSDRLSKLNPENCDSDDEDTFCTSFRGDDDDDDFGSIANSCPGDDALNKVK